MQHLYKPKERSVNSLHKPFSILVLVFCMAFTGNISAQNYTPNTFADPVIATLNNATGEINGGTTISLRSALTAADNLGGTHIITLSTGTYNLTQAIPNRQLTIGNTNQNITINGNGPANTIINMTNDANRDRILFINPTGTTNSPVVSVSGITFQNGYLSSDPYGGAAICAGGGSAESLTITNCAFTNNILPADAYGGAAVCMQVRGNLSIDNSTFTNNVSNDADGGAVLFIIFNSGVGTGFGTCSITNSTFTGNSVVFPGAPTSNGGAVAIAGQAGVSTFNATVARNTFVNNTADGLGGAIAVNNSPNLATPAINFNRFTGNTATAGAASGALHFVESSGSVNTENNWWGCNTGPTATPCDRAGGDVAGGGAMVLTKWLQLKTTASPSTICNTAATGNTSTITTSFLSNSASEAISPANLTALIGRTVNWGPTTLGSLSGQQTTIQASGTATALFTSNGTGGTATVNAQVDNVPVGETTPSRASITVNTASVAPTGATGATTVCSGGTTTLTVSGGTKGTAAVTEWFTGSCGGTLVFTGDAYTTPALVSNTTYFVRYNGTCNVTTCATINVSVNDVTGGTVGTDQTICSGGDPALFTESVASTGSGALTYQWQSSTVSCASGFSNIGGATSATYDAPAGVAVTTYYRRLTTSTLNGVPCTANSNCITVTVNSVTGGTVATDQTICSGGDPAAFTQTVASTGSGTLTYQWQSSTTGCGAGFSDIGGATGTTYDVPAGLLVTTYYRRVTTSTQGASVCTANSNCITVSVNDVTAGTVAADQTVCSGGDPALFTVTVAATGSGALTYQWQSSTTSCGAGFSNIGGATSATYDAPAGLLVTTYYRRIVTSTLNGVPCTATSNCITVTVNNVTGGTVGSDQTICSGGDPALFTESVASTGSGALTYQWQSSTVSCASGFSNIGGANGTTYDAPAGLAVTTYYRRVTTSTLNGVPCTANSNCITVSVNNVTSGTVGSDQSVCTGGDPAAFTVTVASTGSGALTYQWQSSTVSCASGFSDIGGATSATYDAPAGLSVQTFYRRITTSTLNGVPCTAISNCITVSITPDNTITLTSGAGSDNQTVLINTPITNITYTTTGATVVTIGGLPPGVSASGTPSSFMLSGSPTASGVFNYTITLLGGCGNITATGTINVIVCSINLTSAPSTNAQTVCNNTPITNITYSTTGATGATFSGLPAGVTGNWAANVATISGTPTVAGTYNYTVTPTGGGCSGVVTASGTITVNPVPNVNAVANQTYCVGASVPSVVFSSAVGGAVFSWSRTVPTPDIGLAPTSGSGNVPSFTATNTSNAPITATFSVAASYTNNGVTCFGAPIQYTITINPTPNAVATPASQTKCSGVALTTIVLSGNVAGTSYDWTRDNTGTVTGIAASGSGNISGTLTNTTTSPVTVTFTITPSYTNNGVTCTGSSITATVLVNPTPNAVATPASQSICSGSAITPIVLTGAVAGTTFTWTRNNTATVTGIAASGSGTPISGTLTNTTNAPVTVTFTITPTANGCPGPTTTATVVVNPIPGVVTPNMQVIITGNGNFADEISWTLTNSLNVVVLSGGPYGFNPPATPSGTTPSVNAPFTFFIEAQGTFNDNSCLWEVRCNNVVVASGCIKGTNNTNSCPSIGTLTVPNISGCNPLSPQTICSGTAITPITLTGTVAGTTFNWTRDNTANVTGIAASGSGTISGTLTNTTNVPQTVIFTITPTANGCPGSPVTVSILVNPTPNAVATPNSQTICSGTAITPIVLTGNVAGTTYAWTRNNTANVTGMAASGSGTPITGTLTNTTTSLQTTTFTITPTANGCAGPATTATVSVQAPLTIVCPANMTVNAAPGTCAATVTYAATVTGTPAPTVTYSPVSGSSFPIGTTTVTVTATNICGTVTCTFTVTVLDVQIPNITTPPANRTVCIGSNATFSVVSTFASSYQWQTFNGSGWVNIAGATASSYTLNNVPLSLNATSYRVLITGPCGTVTTSTHATLYVNPLPMVTLTISNPPLVNPAHTVTLTATASPAGGIYVWFKNNVVVPGASGNTLGPLGVLDVGTYKVTYTDPNGCVKTSNEIEVRAVPSPHLYVYPNPNTGRFRVQYYNDPNDEATVTVYNYLGSVVYQKKFNAGALQYGIIDVDLGKNLAIGTYLVEVRNSKGVRIGVQPISVGRQ